MGDAPLPQGLARSRKDVPSQQTKPAASRKRSLIYTEMDEVDGRRLCKHCGQWLSACNPTHSKKHLLSGKCKFLASPAAHKWADQDQDVHRALQARCVWAIRWQQIGPDQVHASARACIVHAAAACAAAACHACTAGPCTINVSCC